ncbi:uncharacterized protein LOC8275624 [Ricinus communis]|uniref:Phosphorylated adapter RNA export protein n=1 Tax=Ricinus communis TaxID=3988 RepID=B9RRV2_RICCO|nr:uncharacterized protein LOC8275624 [Ricinus communis]EEF45812.1 conserved hypothetical protein [Ricinus communis]|eukprot:XP_002516471.1 uncharacterized protein LOC8275624 [Ricinus communis]
MEEGESVLEAIYEEEEDEGDVEMVDVEEGEVIEQNSQTDFAKSSNGCNSFESESYQSKNIEHKENKKEKKKNKRKRKKRGGPGPNVTDINRFVLDVCRRLKEKKSYMVYTAVACLGVSRLGDLVKEVDAVLSCGGQMTADGGRFRTGGGILWNIVKTKEPKAYQEIMKKTKEFEKQFRRQNSRPAPQQNKEGSSQETVVSISDGALSSVPNDSQPVPQNQHEQPSTERKHIPVHDRIRVPVSYDDLLGDDPKNDSV